MPSSVPVVNLAAMDDGIPRAAAWERLAEASEAMQDIEGAITAYEQVRVRVRSSEFGVRSSEFGVRSSEERGTRNEERGTSQNVRMRTGLLLERAVRGSITLCASEGRALRAASGAGWGGGHEPADASKEISQAARSPGSRYARRRRPP